MGVNPLALLEGTEEFSSLRYPIEGIGMPHLLGYNQFEIFQTNDQLKRANEQLSERIIQTSFEHEKFKIKARDELKKRDEEIQRLSHLLKVACQERDEAREQLRLLTLKRVVSHTALETIPFASYLQPDSPRLRQQPTRVNSGTTTESDNISDTRNHHSYASSPVDSLLDVETPPELSNTNIADSGHVGIPQKIACYNNNNNNNSPPLISKYDQAFARIEQLAAKRPLPEKGKLMDAVMKAGPLLQGLMVAGPLPRWKNPPSLRQLQIPPVSVQGRNCQTLNQTAALSPNVVQSSINHNGVAMKRSIQLPVSSPAKKQKSQ